MAGLFGGGQTIVNEENKIAGFQVNTATYGLPVPIVFGTTRIAGNIVDWFDFVAIPHETRQEQSGGKGGGGITTVNISYTYQVAVIIGLCEGPISDVLRVWKDKELLSGPAAINLGKWAGGHGQTPWSYAQSVHPERALPYSGLAYLAGVMDLGGSGGLPSLNFEVKGMLTSTGDGIDANPADVCEFILSDSKNGINFGSAAIDSAGLARFRAYAYAADLLISAPLTSQKKPAEIIKAICDAVKVQHFWSADRLKFVPRCDETLTRGDVTYTPITTPEYDLDENDFLEQSDGSLVKFSRVDPAEAYNHVPVEFLNRANEYQKELADGRVDVDINARGLRSASTKEIHYLHTKARAEYVAQLQVMEYLYGRNKYTFTLGWSHCLLEPGDFVTLTDAALGLDKQPVIIDSVEEDENGKLSIVAYGRRPGVYSPARYSTQDANRPSVDYNVAPGDAINPVIFELPAVLSGGIMKAYVAAAGGTNWGGCHVWVSMDGTTYKKVDTAMNPARYGSLSDALPAGAAIDTTNTLKIDVTDSKAILSSGTYDDAIGKRTLCWVDGELIAYQTATLTAANHYDLTMLVRGCYGTPISSHAAGARFVRVDENILPGYGYSAEDLGKTAYIKLQSFNPYGAGVQDLESLVPILHVIVNIAPPDVTSVYVEHLANGRKRIQWGYDYPVPNDVVGFRIKLQAGRLPYWGNAQSIFDGVISQSPWETDAIRSGVYTVMIKAVDAAGNESANHAYCLFNVGDELVENVLQTADFKAAGWIGTKTNCSVNVDGELEANDPGDRMFSDRIAPMFTARSQPMFTAQYDAMTYEGSFIAATSGNLLAQIACDGTALVEYRVRGPNLMFTNRASPMFSDRNAPMFTPGAYLPYTSKMIIPKGRIDIRATITGARLKPTIHSLAAIIDVEDESEVLNDVALSSAGTRLAITKKYHSIKNISATIQFTGTGAQSIQTLDKDAVLGPLVKPFNASGVAVDAVADITIQGIKFVE